jgi:flagellar basal-body rod protein FlgF
LERGFSSRIVGPCGWDIRGPLSTCITFPENPKKRVMMVERDKRGIFCIAMLRGIYIAASGMSGREQAIDVIANNLANVDTIGFKADKLSSQSFGRMLLSRVGDIREGPAGRFSSPPPIGTAQLSGGATDARYVDYSAGSITFTGNPLDLALNGPGFFTIQDPTGGFAYTRNGVFTIDTQNYLVNQEGLQVLDAADMPIRVSGMGDIVIDANGSISIGDLPAGRLGIAEFTDINALQKEGGNLFSAGIGAGRIPAVDTQVIQGAVERSNVNSVAALTQLIARFREFEAAARSLDAIDRTLDKVVNDMSRVNI